MTWRTGITAMTATLVAALAIAGPMPAQTSNEKATESVDEQLREIEMNVAAVAEHAAKLEQMLDMPNTYSHSAHEYEWNRIDARFDEAGKKIPAIQSATKMEEWKKDVVDDISALMAAMGAQIESATNILTETASVERLHTRNLYPLRIRSVQSYAEMIDAHIEVLQEWNEATS